MRDAPTTRVERFALGLAPFAALAPALFVAVRAVSERRAPEPDPAVVIWSERSSLVGHVGVTGYVVVALAVLLAPQLVRRPALAARAFEACVAVSVAAALVGGAMRR